MFTRDLIAPRDTDESTARIAEPTRRRPSRGRVRPVEVEGLLAKRGAGTDWGTAGTACGGRPEGDDGEAEEARGQRRRVGTPQWGKNDRPDTGRDPLPAEQRALRIEEPSLVPVMRMRGNGIGPNHQDDKGDRENRRAARTTAARDAPQPA